MACWYHMLPGIAEREGMADKQINRNDPPDPPKGSDEIFRMKSK